VSATQANRTGPRRVGVIDGFRAYAILGVVVLHLITVAGALEPGTTSSLIFLGLLGNVIDAFFIISGFGLFLAVAKGGGNLGSLRTYAAGRAARLIPAYWITLAVMVVLLAVDSTAGLSSGIQRGEGLPSVQNLTVHLAGLQMPARMFDSNLLIGFGINGPLWMISVIVCFYVVFPVVARPYYRHPLLGLAIAAAVTVGWRELVLHAPGLFSALDTGHQPAWVVRLIAIDQFPGWAFSFALGMTAAWAYVKWPPVESAEMRRRAARIAVPALAAFLVCAYLYGHNASEVTGPTAGSIARTSPLLVIAFTLSRGILMAAIALGPLWLRAPFESRGTRALADSSYGLYLIHLPIAIYLGAVVLSLPDDGSTGTLALWFGAVVPLSLLYAYVVRRFAEQPVRSWVASGAHASSRHGSVRDARIGRLRRTAGARR
jgi:peptidoglycan/LPS O-acetylase OafA/YrhL